MNAFFFHPDEYRRLYNCSLVDPSENAAKPNLILGFGYLTVGVVLEALYIPCLKVLWSPSMRRMSCFKLMFQLGILDMCCLLVNSVITGYLAARGARFCDYPNFIYVTGSIVLGLWCATCATSITLGISRSIDFWSPTTMKTFFSGRRTYFWCAMPLVYGALIAWFTRAAIYSPYGHAWFFDPYYNMTNIKIDRTVFKNMPHSINNTATVIIFFALYIFLSFSVWWKSRKAMLHNRFLSEMQKQVIIQSCVICFFNLLAAFVYVYMQWFHTPDWLIVIGHATWICCHGGAVVVYLTLNKTVQKEILGLLRVTQTDPWNIPYVGTVMTSNVAPLPLNMCK